MKTVRMTKGVRPTGDKFEARISENGKRRSLGIFDTEQDALTAYRNAKIVAINTKPIPYSVRKDEITQSRLKQVLAYDLNTGVFTRVARSGVIAGTIAGTLKPDGYRQVRVDGRKHYAARLALLYVTGIYPDFVDHINGDRDDNRFSNLRQATKVQNGQNIALSKRNSSGYTGVSWREASQKWLVRIMLERRSIHIGYAETAEQGYEMYLAAKRKYHDFQPIPRSELL